ncbi:MAG: hypothetical protein GVY10_11650 [Verrucomicrobia bacterium]|jgi:hypothetical protein|nr:hypothetical protein [Verrucomicrobiota bacterium]
MPSLEGLRKQPVLPVLRCGVTAKVHDEGFACFFALPNSTSRGFSTTAAAAETDLRDVPLPLRAFT